MHPDDEDVAIEVALPPELLREMDAFAVQRGYESPSAVVRAALEEAE